MQPLRIFIGYDPRQAVSYHVLCHSILSRASVPVAITPLVYETLPVQRQGLTPFTFTRFLVPELCGHQGPAIFLDADILVLGDVFQLLGFLGSHHAIAVRKDCAPFERAAVMVWNCGHYAHRALIPSYIDSGAGKLHKIGWLQDDQIGEIPEEWGHLVLYDEPKPDCKLVHFTGGVPYWPETFWSEYADEWRAEMHETFKMAADWYELMGRSVHYDKVRDAYEEFRQNEAKPVDPKLPPWPHTRPGEAAAE